jgi:hypothetical protein
MKYLLISIVLFLPGWTLSAQDINFTASAPKVVAAGEQFRLTYTINAEANAFNPPDLSDFYVLMGPSTSYNQSTQIINGKITRSVSYTYTYVLQATKKGNYIIPPAQATIKRTSYESNPVEIEVVPGTASIPPSTQEPSEKSAGETVNVNNEDLFVRILMNKPEVYQGEHIIATIKLYSRINLSGFDNIKFPSFNGFFKQDIETPPLRSLERENVNGQIYGTGVLQKVVLFPQRNGEIEIDPVELECLIQQRVKRDSRNPFDNFFDDFFDSYQTVKKTIKSPPLRIKVKPLPETKPATFKGAVGLLKMNASIDKTEAKVNDAINLIIDISGNGNIKIIEAPVVHFPPDFETYDPKISAKITNTSNGATGFRKFEYLVIPRHAGNYRIPPVEFSYFDPTTENYKTLASNEFNITVEKAEEEETTVISGFSKEDIKLLGSDIRFIKTGKIKLRPKDRTIFGSTFFIFCYTGAFALFIAFLIIHRKRIKRKTNLILVKNRRANKLARRRLKTARFYQKNENREKFYEEILKAIWGYLSDKLNIPVSELSKETAVKILSQYQIDKSLVNQITELIDTCEYAQYAPAEESAHLATVYENTLKTISKFEQKIK